MPKLRQKPFRDRLKNYLFFGLFTLILIYFIFRLNGYIVGPKIIIYTPAPYTIINDDTFIIQGNVKNAKNIYINGREINITENGDFAERLITKAPYTLITIEAVDRYEKRILKTMSIGKE